ncbi:MAG: porphobilinogen synthase [Methanomicrobiaceae archaeon]|nr:porphobilinogen synthase [Methanomicrobiaceae archaeon]
MFPKRRMRRLRKRVLQPVFKETRLAKEELIMPLFFDANATGPVPIPSMPGQFRYPVEMAGAIATRIRDAGIRGVLLFGIPKEKDEEASGAYDPEGVIQQAVRRIRTAAPGIAVITDLCACEYTIHGHCGIVGETAEGPDLLNDPSLELMGKIAVSHAESGADMVAPSSMLDGVVGAVRQALDEAGFSDTPIMSYSSKYASSLYGPFREAADSGYAFGDRSTYQMSPANWQEAVMESTLDIQEGADVLMVKPAGFYLDVIAAVSALGIPVAAYQVSGEYAMIRAAAMQGWLDERAVVMESLIGIKRAGADVIITYFAEEVAGWLDEEQ